MRGASIALINRPKTAVGLFAVIFNWGKDETKGLQLGLLNDNRRYMNEFPIQPKRKTGGTTKGVQLGVLNYRKSNRKFARMLPIVNFRIE